MPDIQQELMIQPEEAKLAAQSMTPMDLLQMAVQKGVDIDQLGKLMELQERWMANQAKVAYSEAITKFKESPPKITKNKHVRFETSKGVTEYDHTTLDHLVDEVTKALSDVGITIRWSFPPTPDVITVTCILTHRLGHSETATLSGPADVSGNKNPIQARNSTVTYLERYTLFACCGLAPQGIVLDDDGSSASAMPPDWLSERLDWLENCRNMDELSKQFRLAYQEAAKAKDKNAMHALIAKKDAKKKELSCE